MASVEQTLLTAEEFGRRPDVGPPEELVRGRIVMSPPPNRGHGFTCIEVGFHLRLYLEVHRLGRAYGNDSGIIIERNPDTVRGADVAYYSYERLPEGSPSTGYGPEVPELVFEVKIAQRSLARHRAEGQRVSERGRPVRHRARPRPGDSGRPQRGWVHTETWTKRRVDLSRRSSGVRRRGGSTVRVTRSSTIEGAFPL